MGLLQWLFGWASPDDRDRREHDAERKLSVSMPMAAAGAELAAQKPASETEQELRETAGDNPKQ
jgi:hypothetical protein